MHADEKAILDLVGSIYDGVADPALWQDALVRLSDATHSVGAMFMFLDRVHPRQSRYVLGRLDPDLTRVFLNSPCGLFLGANREKDTVGRDPCHRCDRTRARADQDAVLWGDTSAAANSS
jgi:hypothetical protein